MATGDHRLESYLIERRLAARLRAAPREARPQVARKVYADLYRLVHWHPDLKRSRAERARTVAALEHSYGRWVESASAVLEVGAGSCEFARRLGPKCPGTFFVAIDVARAPLDATATPLPRNTAFVQVGAATIPFKSGSFDFVFCSQVLEHFHPDDVPEHLLEIARVLKPGGWFGLDTPNRICGPHDVSRGFTPEATGLHLKEWTHEELRTLLLSAGFDAVFSRVLPGRVCRWLHLRAPGPLVDARVKSHVERIVSLFGRWSLGRLLARMGGVEDVCLYARRCT